MIDLDSDKWLAVKIACDLMASTQPGMNAIYAWLAEAAEHNAKEALDADRFGREALAIVAREPRYQ